MLVEKQFIFGDNRLNYAEGPDSGPPLLLLHGNTWRWQSFLPIIPVLSLRWKIFALDFRGHGNSKHIPNSYSLDNFLADTLMFIENVIKKPVYIFGHSMGGAVSFLLAEKRPEMVKGLVIGDVSIQFENVEKSFKEAHEQIIQSAEWAGLKISNLELLQKIMDFPMKLPDQKKKLPWKDHPGEIPWLLSMAQNLSKLDPTAQESGISLETMRENWKLYDCHRFLPKILCPTLLLQANAKLGGMMSDSDVQLALKHIKYAVHVKFDYIGHDLFATKAEPILQVIINFLEMLRE
ncbi:MAG: alpha/beta fold hydrolase [Promethearchaeota archaeon]